MPSPPPSPAAPQLTTASGNPGCGGKSLGFPSLPISSALPVTRASPPQPKTRDWAWRKARGCGGRLYTASPPSLAHTEACAGLPRQSQGHFPLLALLRYPPSLWGDGQVGWCLSAAPEAKRAPRPSRRGFFPESATRALPQRSPATWLSRRAALPRTPQLSHHFNPIPEAQSPASGLASSLAAQ